MSSNSTIEVFMPGRLCLLGEHSDWAATYKKENEEISNGMTLVMGLDKGIYIRASKNEKLIYRCNLPNLKVEINAFMDNEELEREIEKQGINTYVIATTKILKDIHNIGGLEVECYKMDLPIKKGLSSSAAICMAIIRAANTLYSLELTVYEEMELAYKAEHIAGSKCGRMDQVCAFGNSLFKMDFIYDEVSIKEVKTTSNLNILVVDLNGKKNTTKILSDLNSRYPFSEKEEDKLLYKALGEYNIENINTAIDALINRDIKKLGNIFDYAQKIFDEYVSVASPKELESKRLHEILNDRYIRKYIYGGKGVGSQGDGSAQLLLKDKKSGEILKEYIKKKYGYESFCLSTGGNNEIKKAIIPLAGYGTRIYPMTKVLSKALLPIVDTDGLVKPVLLIQLDELVKSGIEKICLVVRENQEDIRELFEEKYRYELENNYFSVLENLRDKVEFIIQEEQNGLGDAVARCKDFSESESTLVLLGDHLLKSSEKVPCTKQFISAWKSNQENMLSIKEVALEDVSNYGIVSGSWIDKENKILKVDKFVEKPSKEYAMENLKMESPNGKIIYYAVFGEYIINDLAYELIREKIIENKEKKKENNKEIGLTESLDKLCDLGLLNAIVINGQSYDIGIPEKYYDTFCKWGSKLKDVIRDE